MNENNTKELKDWAIKNLNALKADRHSNENMFHPSGKVNYKHFKIVTKHYANEMVPNQPNYNSYMKNILQRTKYKSLINNSKNSVKFTDNCDHMWKLWCTYGN